LKERFGFNDFDQDLVFWNFLAKENLTNVLFGDIVYL
jgi:hypothetical protein